MASYTDIGLEGHAHVGLIEIRRPPLNFFDASLIQQIADALEEIDNDPNMRAVVLAAQGKTFCAGAQFGETKQAKEQPVGSRPVKHLYDEAARIFHTKKPIVAAVQGAAIGGGLGLALVADFRVTCPEARFSANFTKLGFHPGFGLTVTLGEAIGKTNAELMIYTGRRVNGEDALKIGLASVLVAQAEVRTAALKLAAEIAESGPLALLATRATMRAGLAERVEIATRRELAEQTLLRATDDFKEGVRASAERRLPNFTGR